MEATYWVNATKLRHGQWDDRDEFVWVGNIELDWPAGVAPSVMLEWCFDVLNRHDSPTQSPILDERHAPSLSVGDVIVVGETAYYCASVGWDIVPTDAWSAVNRHRWETLAVDVTVRHMHEVVRGE